MKAFQLKIMIKNSKPPIWRRVVVPAGITFSQLSMILNEVMGWSGCHMFEFEFYHLELRIMEGVDEFDVGYGPFDYLEASTTFVREYLEQNDWFTYTYDLGDDWTHRVTVEKVLEDYELNYPKVLKYKGDCPMEDCGGLDGFYEFLEIVQDPSHPEYEERLEWMEMQGFLEEYDMNEVNEYLEEAFFYIWGKGENRRQDEIFQDIFSGHFGMRATMEDKNEEILIHRSDRHQVEDAMRQLAQFMRTNAYWEQMCRSVERMQDPGEREMLENLLDSRGREIQRDLPESRGRSTQEKTTHSNAESAQRKVIDFQSARQNRVSANDPCPCGSGKKYKDCCKKKK